MTMREWNGGECPVSRDDDVEVKFRGSGAYRDHSQNIFRWKHIDDDKDIIAYRVWS